MNQDISTHASNSHIFNQAIANGHGRNLLPANSLPGISYLNQQNTNSLSINVMSRHHPVIPQTGLLPKEMSLPAGNMQVVNPG